MPPSSSKKKSANSKKNADSKHTTSVSSSTAVPGDVAAPSQSPEQKSMLVGGNTTSIGSTTDTGAPTVPPEVAPTSSNDQAHKTSTASSGEGPLAVPASSPSQSTGWPEPVYYQTVILGAGLSGLCMAIQLKRKGYGDDFIILDREKDIAGTWTSNTYPGAGADVPAPLYSFSFRQKTDWSTFFPKQPELKSYFAEVAAEFELSDKFHMQTTVQEARFDEVTNLWHIYTEDLPDRATSGVQPAKHHFVCKLFVSAVGGLSQPNECNIPGHENFKGQIFHSAQWDHSVSLQDRNVVVVGNGSSATQFVPHLAKQCKNVTQIVRSQHWIQHQPENPFNKIPGWRWLVRHFAFFRNLQRFAIWLVMESMFIGHHMNSVGAMWRSIWSSGCAKYIKGKAPKTYWNQLIPDVNVLPPLHKRRILDDGYLDSLNLSNVRLETGKAVQIEENAVVLATGEKIPADVIVLATGFTTARAGFPMALYGRKGQEVREQWQKFGGPTHYRSTFLANFPSLVCINGTNSATGHMSLIYTTECQVLLGIEVAKPLLDGTRPSEEAIKHNPNVLSSKSLSTFASKTPSFEVKLSAHLSEQNWIQDLMSRRVFSHGPGSWYIDKTSGRVTAMHPDWQWKLFLRCLFPNWADYVYTDLKNGQRYPSERAWWKVFANKWLGIGKVPKVTPQKAGLPDYPELHAA
ncbi:unnamed protein product [Sympodiomycopsis kandeliae]